MGTHRASDHATDRSEPGRETFSVTVTFSPDDFGALARRVAEIIEDRSLCTSSDPPPSQFVTIEEAADLLRTKRQRVDDLLSQGRLTRVKDGRRTLIARTEVLDHLSASFGVATALPRRPQTRMNRPFGP